MKRLHKISLIIYFAVAAPAIIYIGLYAIVMLPKVFNGLNTSLAAYYVQY